MRGFPTYLRTWLPRLPVLLGAGLLALACGQIVWNASLGTAFPRLHMRVKQVLLGQGAEQPVPPSWNNLLTGRFQQDFATNLGKLSVLRRDAVRWKTQVYYSAFGMSAWPNIVVGDNRQLFQWPYIQEFCTRDLAQFRPRAEAWVTRLRALQDDFQRRGKRFLYLITPSKAAVYPNYLPPDFTCRSQEADRAGKLTLYRKLLDNGGVDYVDAAGRVEANKNAFDVDLFPRGGAHWNRLAAALAAQTITAHVNQSERLLTPFEFDWRISWHPAGSDRDLYDVLNLVFRDDHYPVPELSYRSASPPQCRPAHIVEVTGSFIFEVNEVLAQIACRPAISAWFYWDLKHFEYPNGEQTLVPADPARRSQDILRDADLVILEENESVLPQSGHAEKLMQLMAGQVTAAK
ncbi:MAG: hypothetical protein JO212_13890 [Acetobacteraceae bacterium]|nr:hypothetical protein [Acetobacteraceae bacterium]